MSASLPIALLALGLASPTPEAGAEPERPRLAVMAIAGVGVPEDYAVGVTETVATAVARTGVFDTVSPRQISSLLAYEQKRDALGDCRNEACYAQVARVIQADHLLGGSVVKVGERLVLNLVLMRRSEGSSVGRISREAADAGELMRLAASAPIALLQPLLLARRGYLRVTSNVEDAALLVDGEARSERVGQVLALSAGPHQLEVRRDGFYPASVELSVQPGRLGEEAVTLIPARATIAAYESKAGWMRAGAWITTVLAVGAGVTSGVFYARATDSKRTVDEFVGALALDQAAPGRRSAALEAADRFEVDQAIYLAGLGTAVVSGTSALLLFLLGDDPDRYEDFADLEP